MRNKTWAQPGVIASRSEQFKTIITIALPLNYALLATHSKNIRRFKWTKMRYRLTGTVQNPLATYSGHFMNYGIVIWLIHGYTRESSHGLICGAVRGFAP